MVFSGASSASPITLRKLPAVPGQKIVPATGAGFVPFS